MKSVMSHSFSQVPSAQIPRSAFNRSHGHKTTFNSGYLVPIYVDEALPGDTFTLRMNAFARLATPAVPIMDNLFMDSFFFAVPLRLIWDNWERFNGAQDDPDDSTDFLTPIMAAPASTGYAASSLSDYFGIPTEIADLEHVSFWHRAYNLIWNEWFRDQNLQDSVVVDKDNGPDSPTDYVLLRRGKRHDYFTSCLPWPQKGPAVPLPLGTEAPIRGKQWDDTVTDRMYGISETEDQVGYLSTTSGSSAMKRTGSNTGADYPWLWQQDGDATASNNAGYNYADLSEATAATINALRSAFQVQKLYERDARGGTRYTEIIRSHFGVVSPDARLQRPEYLGGGSSPINIHPVAQTSGTEDSGAQLTPQGNLAAFGTASIGGHGFSKSFTEHCVLLGLVSVRADLNYQQGLNRMFSRRTRWDYYWPALSHIGEQGVLYKEIYAQGPGVTTPGETDEDVFGYQERYAEYRYKPSQITGQFRSNFAQSLDVWHLAQDFESLPMLDESFIQDTPPVQRVIAVPGEVEFLFDSFFSLKTARPMPVYSVPGLIDHF